jgi:hypothetical protein
MTETSQSWQNGNMSCATLTPIASPRSTVSRSLVRLEPAPWPTVRKHLATSAPSVRKPAEFVHVRTLSPDCYSVSIFGSGAAYADVGDEVLEDSV